MRIKNPNKQIKKLFKEKKKSVYGFGKKLGITPQAAEYLIKKKDIQSDYNRIKDLAEYLEVEINELFNE